MSRDAEIVLIWSKRFKRGPMDRIESGELVAGRGLRGSANQGGKRQLTVITEGAWDEAQEAMGMAVDPGERRANVMIRGVDLENSSGKLLTLGPCVIRILGEVKPCVKIERAVPGLRDALRPRWRGGVFGEILEGGTIRVGDAAQILSSEHRRIP